MAKEIAQFSESPFPVGKVSEADTPMPEPESKVLIRAVGDHVESGDILVAVGGSLALPTPYDGLVRVFKVDPVEF